MLFPTLASGVFLALLGAPSVLAIRDPQPVNTHLPVPAPIPSPLSLAAKLDALRIRSDSPDDINPSDPSDTPDPLRPTRARPERPRRAPAPAAYEHINPTDLPTRTLTQAEQIAPRARALTNAQRLANGLPPLAPRRRQRPRVAHAPRSSPKPCTNPTGTLTVTDVDTGAGVPFGQVGSMANAFGEYGLGGIESGPGALNVVLLQCNSDGAPFEVQTTNGLGNFTFFGGIVGFGSIDDNISDANSNYIYVGGTSEVSPGPAQDAPNGFTEATGTERDIESALWTLGALDNSLTMNWINTDGTPAQGAHLLYVANANAIVLTGNVDLFRARFGPAPEVALTFVADK